MYVYTIFLFSALCLMSANASKEVFNMPAKFSAKVKGVGQKCIKEEGAPSDFLENIFPWNYPKNEVNEKALYCYVLNIGLTNKDGIFNVDKVYTVFSSSAKFEEIKKAFDECNRLKGSSPQETAFIISECFFDRAPIKLYM